MPRNLSLSPVRSGRFKNITASPDTRTIISSITTASRIYRFHNTKRRGFISVTVGRSTAEPVPAGEAIDITVPANSGVKVGAGDEGVFDLVEAGIAIRAGYFEGASSKIAILTQPHVYRIINSGEDNITVGSVEIASESSADVVVNGDVTVTGSADSEGIFEFVQ